MKCNGCGKDVIQELFVNDMTDEYYCSQECHELVYGDDKDPICPICNKVMVQNEYFSHAFSGEICCSEKCKYTIKLNSSF